MTKKAIAPHLKKVLQDYLNTVKNAKKSDLEKPFIPQDNTDFILAIERCLISSYLLGMIHAEEENPDRKINAGDEDIPPVPFAQAIDFLKARVPMTKKEWEKLEPKLRFRAFTVAKLSEPDIINKAKSILVKALENGGSYASTWEDLKNRIEVNAFGITPNYWETVFRTNTQTAYMAGKLMQYEKLNNIVAYQLLIIEDVRTSKICRRLLTQSGRGMIIPIDHQFWKKYGFSPYHMNCRSSIRAIFKNQIGKDRIVTDNPSMKSLAKFKPQKGFGGNPISKGSFWLMSEDMKSRAIKYGLIPDIVKMAHNLGLSNFDFELAGDIVWQKLEGYDYKVKKIKSAKPEQKEVLCSQILENHGHSIVMLPECGSQGISNPDALIDYSIVADYKVPDGNNIASIYAAFKKAEKQKVSHMIFFPRWHDYTQQEAIKEIKLRLKNTKHVKEVWLEWDGDEFKIKK